MTASGSHVRAFRNMPGPAADAAAIAFARQAAREACIAAGGEAQVGIRLTPSDCEYGVAVERIRIVTDDPERPMLTVRATAVIEQ